MRRDGFLASDWSQDEHDLVDVVHFVLFYRTMRASQRKTDADSTQRVLGALRDALATYLGAALDTYLVEVYLPGREDKPPPALISPRKRVGQRYVRVQPEAIWDLFSQALDSGVSLAQVAVVRGQDPHVGCHETRARAWLAKLNDMYRDRRRLAFDRIQHLNIVAGPSTHNKKKRWI